MSVSGTASASASVTQFGGSVQTNLEKTQIVSILAEHLVPVTSSIGHIRKIYTHSMTSCGGGGGGTM